MTERRQTIRLFEALELRSEYDARIKTLRDSMPETRRKRRDSYLSDDRAGSFQPADGFDPSNARELLSKVEFKRRKLNAAIQQANFAHQLHVGDDEFSLTEALDARKQLNNRLGEMHTEAVESAWARVIHKEERDIVEPGPVPYAEATQRLDEARVEFRQLNRAIRSASFEVEVEFSDE